MILAMCQQHPRQIQRQRHTQRQIQRQRRRQLQRQSAQKTHHMLYFQKAGSSRISDTTPTMTKTMTKKKTMTMTMKKTKTKTKPYQFAVDRHRNHFGPLLIGYSARECHSSTHLLQTWRIYLFKPGFIFSRQDKSAHFLFNGTHFPAGQSSLELRRRTNKSRNSYKHKQYMKPASSAV